MLVYRLQHKQTGQFLVAVVWYNGKPRWNGKGTLFRTIDSMKKHLGYLIGEAVEREKDGWPRNTKYKGSKHYKWSERWDEGRFHYKAAGFKYRISRLKYYQIVVNDVLVKGEEIIQATDLIEGIKL